MNLLICGVGRVARHLLRRLGEGWRVTLVDKTRERIEGLLAEFHVIRRMVTGDASSPVVLDDVKVGDFDYVLALSNSDQVNLAIVRHASSRGVRHLLALVNEEVNVAQFEEIGVPTVLASAMLAKTIYHYLQDPRIKVTPISPGRAEFLEMEASHHFRMVGKRVDRFISQDWRLVAILRHGELLFPDPDTVIASGDRAVILGRSDMLKPICDILECGHPHFPTAYGQDLLLAIPGESDPQEIVRESIYLGRNTKVSRIRMLCGAGESGLKEQLKTWSQNIDMELQECDGILLPALQESCREGDSGIAVIDPVKGSILSALTKPVLISLAHSLPCPLLVARHTDPYDRILVPFNGKPCAELALEIAADLGKQLESEISVVVVEEPEVIRGSTQTDWLGSVLEKVHEISHIHKIELSEIVRKGNPVKEILDVAPGFNLMIMGSGSREKRLFSPHVGELLAQNAPCSVLIVTS